ncbi:hypothetical protein [Methanomethylovorans hollandica]|nr:hypothetical protein [Methanomethylovorans hollandica]
MSLIMMRQKYERIYTTFMTTPKKNKILQGSKQRQMTCERYTI